MEESREIRINKTVNICIIIGIIDIMFLLLALFSWDFYLVLPILFIGIGIILNRLAKISQIKQDLKIKNAITIGMIGILMFYILLSALILIGQYKKLLYYEIKEIIIGIDIAIVMLIGMIIIKINNRIFKEKRIEQKVNKFDITLLVITVICMTFIIGIIFIEFFPMSKTEPYIDSNAEQIAKRTFNSNFTPYEGENQSAAQIRRLKSAVEASNASNYEDRQIELDMKEIKLTSRRKYKVSITEYEDGYIKKIIVTEMENSKDDKEENQAIDRRTFNSNFILYVGNNISEYQVRTLESAVEESNEKKENVGHQVELVMPKEGLSNSKKYKVEIEYGKDGYVNKIIITEAKNEEMDNVNILNNTITNEYDLIVEQYWEGE